MAAEKIVDQKSEPQKTPKTVTAALALVKVVPPIVAKTPTKKIIVIGLVKERAQEKAAVFTKLRLFILISLFSDL